MFDLNITLVIQLVNFIVTLVALDFLLIRPIRGIVKRRRDLANGLLGEAEKFTTGATEKLENYEAVLAKAREEGIALRESRKAEAGDSEAVLLEAARNEAQDFLTTSRKNTREAVAQTMTVMENRIPELSGMVAEKLLGKSKRSSAA